ncbi:MAG: FecR family protein [Tannerella sp.]|jgi:ferric-dicitrate binding protein FerR (iron transport regulator)|nr:FecR family protein [Tannerella sp.]
MIIKRKEDIIKDIAWGHLCNRLKQDGLLPEKLTANAYENAPANTLEKLMASTHETRTKNVHENVPANLFRKNASLIRIATAAVAVLLTSVFSILYMVNHASTPERKLLVLHNEANAPTLATMLHDGSVVYLSGQTSLTYPDKFDENKREVTLNGEAFFEINKNDGCPFFIDTDPATIEVTGTAFNVKSNDPSSFSLSVRDGEVHVSLKTRRQTVSVKVGETVSLDAERQQLSKTNNRRVVGRFRRVHFKDERLGNIVSIINAHSDSTRLKIDPKLESRLLTMPVSFENNLPETVEIICMVLNLQYSLHEGLIYISKKE